MPYAALDARAHARAAMAAPSPSAAAEAAEDVEDSCSHRYI